MSRPNGGMRVLDVGSGAGDAALLRRARHWRRPDGIVAFQEIDLSLPADHQAPVTAPAVASAGPPGRPADRRRPR